VERDPIWGNGRRGTQRGGLAAVRKSVIERWSMVA
jgi:hypothetical protein